MEKIKITLQIEPQTHRELELEREKKGITLTELINIILYEYYFVD